MHVYDVILLDTNGLELTRSNFEAADDAAAHDLLIHYYSDRLCELRHEGRLVERLTPPVGEATP